MARLLFVLGLLLHGCSCGFDPVPDCRGRVCDGGAGGGSGGGMGGSGGAGDAGCSTCVPGTLRWGPNGGLAAWYDESALSACRHYQHKRTTLSPTMGVTTCEVELDACALQTIAEALATPQVQTALASQALFGIDSRPVDGQVFEVGVEDGGYFDVGACTAGDCGVNGAIEELVEALKALDTQQLAKEPCKSTFP